MFVCRWAHVMCAVALPEARFTDEVQKSPIDTSRIPVQRYKLVSEHAQALGAGPVSLMRSSKS